jgi:hypothetical protein
MPIGGYKDFGACVSAQIKKGKSKESAGAICGKIEKNTREGLRSASSIVKYEDDNGHLYIKAWMLDASVNINRWGVNNNSIPERISSAYGKPLVLTQGFHHPLPPEMMRKGDNEQYDDDDNPYNTVNVHEIVDHWLAYQEVFRVGTIIDVVEKKGSYFAIIEVTDPAAKEAFRNNDLPLFVSPAIAQLDPREDPSNITNWTFVHLAIVADPAYTMKKAIISGQCHDEKERCLLQLRQAEINTKDYDPNTWEKLPKIGCGFCRYDALAKYAEIVKSWRTRHSVPIKSKNATSLQEFSNSSIDFSESQIEPELTEDNSNSNSNNDTNNTYVKKDNVNSKTVVSIPKDTNNQTQDFERVQKEQGGDLGEQAQKGQTVVTTSKTKEEETKSVDKEAEAVAARVAGMEECVQIFQQNGVQPDQAMQICKLAAQALMDQQNQNTPNGGGQQQGAPKGTGQFGSIDYEKQLAKQETRIAELQEELKTYKKGDKTDAQRIAELEEQVTKITREKTEKEFEAYLVTKIGNKEDLDKKIKRFADLNLTLEDVKDIYPETNAPKGNTGQIKKVAEIETNPSPIAKAKLHVASTGEQQEVAKTASSEIKERNNRIVSSLLSKGGYN